MLLIDIIEWPMNARTISEFLADKYSNPDGIHHYEITKIVVVQQVKVLMITHI